MKNILIIDDHELIREGIKRIFAPGTAVFGEAGTAQEALGLLNSANWDLALLDLSLGDRCGLQLLRELKQKRPRLPVLIVTMHSEEDYARRAFKAGASGYVTKGGSRDELERAINWVIAGHRYITPELAEKIIVDLETGADLSPHDALSNREFEVLRLLATGRTVTEIAGLLDLSSKTISTHRAHILDKMGMKNNAELVYYAVRNNLLQ